ncbi:MAG: hypothetical protein HRU29_08770 [Rhizobiales bacterium]|nr:hypothetical protein [Hyphomicrobiales bacterium]NRB14480.1 hypothetical protein [Hyphomicrobiales bacterium]
MADEQEKTEKEIKTDYRLLIFGAAVVVLLWAAMAAYVYLGFNFGIVRLDENAIGPMGDAFGSLTSLFTGLAFIGLIWTILQQHTQLKTQQIELKNNTEQLRLQRKELKLQREETARSTEQLEGQREAIELQNLQNRYFGQLQIYNSKLNNIEHIVTEYTIVKTLRGVSAAQTLTVVSDHSEGHLRKFSISSCNKANLVKHFANDIYKFNYKLDFIPHNLVLICKLAISLDSLTDDKRTEYIDELLSSLRQIELRILFVHLNSEDKLGLIDSVLNIIEFEN